MEHDGQLLERYRTLGDEAAFRSLVERYQNLVYATALRRTRNAALAQEVGQQVMVALARKGRGLESRANVATWLYRAAVYEANSLMKRETRREDRHRRHSAEAETETPPDQHEDVWTSLEPVLDQALHTLGEKDRQAVLLRYFQDLTYAQTAERMGSTEEAIRKRVTRSLDKMMIFFRRRGIVTTAGVLAAMIPMKASIGAPAGFAAAAVKSAMAVKPAWYAAFTWSSMAAAAKANAAAIAIAAVAVPVAAWQYQSNQSLRTENQRLSERLANLERAPLLAASVKREEAAPTLLAASSSEPKRPSADQRAKMREHFRDMEAKDKEQRLLSTVAVLRDQLQLSPSQEETVRTSLATAQETRHKARELPPFEQVQARAEAIRKRDREILATLNPEQKGKFDHFRVEEQENEIEVSATEQLTNLQKYFSPTESQKDLAFEVFAEHAARETTLEFAKATNAEELKEWMAQILASKLSALEMILTPEQFQAWSTFQERGRGGPRRR